MLTNNSNVPAALLVVEAQGEARPLHLEPARAKLRRAVGRPHGEKGKPQHGDEHRGRDDAFLLQFAPAQSVL